jgi:hypothetical protein
MASPRAPLHWRYGTDWRRCLPIAPIARFRSGGLHRELISARLYEALAQGCDLATASTLPGSGSQRNYERLGFEVVYTKIDGPPVPQP